MISEFDAYPSPTAASARISAEAFAHETRHPAAADFRPFSRALAERDSAFERSHGSLWQAGLLDRLSVPLSRYHE